MAQRTLPAQRADEDPCAYVLRLKQIRDQIRRFLPTLCAEARREGQRLQMSRGDIAAAMGISIPTLYAGHAPKDDLDISLLPARDGGESALQYYTRLRQLRDTIRDALPGQAAVALTAAEASDPPRSRTQAAAAMGLSESGLDKLLATAERHGRNMRHPRHRDSKQD